MSSGAVDAVLRVPFISLNPNYACTYSRPVDNYSSRERNQNSLDNLKHNKHVGDLSAPAKKRLLNTVNWMVYACKHNLVPDDCDKLPAANKIGFVTLTLSAPQFHHDKEIKSKMLNHFLTVLRQEFNVLYYVWKAEKQANGNIHFHVTIDRYIHWSKLRKLWNSIQEKMGYISEYKDKMSKLTYEQYEELMKQNGYTSEKKIIEAWNTGNNNHWSDPNSTDVHAVRKIKDIAAYIGKYVSKSVQSKSNVMNASLLKDSDFDINSILKTPYADLEDDFKQLITGRIWGCSQLLSKMKSVQDVICDEVEMTLNKMTESKDVKRLVTDYSTMFFFRAGVFIDRIFKPFHQLMKRYIQSINKVIGDIPEIKIRKIDIPIPQEIPISNLQYKLL